MTDFLFPELREEGLYQTGLFPDIPDLTQEIRQGMDCCCNCKNSDRCSVYRFVREVEKTDNIKLIVPECYRSLYEPR